MTVFAGTKRALPFLTTAMLGLLVAAGTGVRLALRNPALQLRFDAAWLTVPLVGRLARGYNAARFASTLAMLAVLLPIIQLNQWVK